MSDNLTLVVRSEPTDQSMTAEYHQWYSKHVDELLRVPGVLSGRRFECVEGELQFMAMYAITDFSIFSTPEYREIQGFGPMTEHVRFTRNVYRDMPVDGPR